MNDTTSIRRPPAPHDTTSLVGHSPRGSWAFTTWRPAVLEGLVDHFWTYTGPTLHRRKRVFPNGRVELVLNFGRPYRLLDADGSKELVETWIGGPQSRAAIIEQPERQHLVGVRLRPAGAFAIVSRPLDELAGLTLDLRELVGEEADRLWERCESAHSATDRFLIAGDWITARLARTCGMKDALGWAVGAIDSTRGMVPIATLRERTGLSKSGLVDGFRKRVGLAPKLYARVIRFHRALRRLQSAGDVPLAELAAEAGFYDQPHMNSEFRALGGLSPREFLASRHPVGDGSTAGIAASRA